MILGYIRKAFFYAVFFTIVYMVCRIICIRKMNIKINIRHEMGLGLFWIYIFVLLSQTILPLWQCGFCDGKFYIQITRYANGSVNLIPFKTIAAYLHTENAIQDWSAISALNLLANIGLFVPIGLLFPIAYCNRLGTVLLVGGSLSVFIEIVQLTIGRSSDIDDVLLNVLGTFIGLILYRILKKILKKDS